MGRLRIVQSFKTPYFAIVLLISSFVFLRSRCRRRRGFLEVPRVFGARKIG